MKRAVASIGSRRAGVPVGVPVRIDEGVDIPLEGAPEQVVSDAAEVRSIALVGTDYIGLRPLMKVEEGDRVKLGQPLFADRSNPEILFTSPGSGIVTRINRGPRRALHSVVVDLAGDEEITFDTFGVDQLAGLGRDQIAARLLASGLWTALRSRPFSRVADPRTMPRSIFITATDSNPLAARPELVIARHRDDFLHGLTVVAGLTEGPTFLCQAPGVEAPTGGPGSVETVEFSGPHPSGLVGTHIHFLDPVSAERTVWHLGYQDVIAIGKLFTTGRLWVERTVALAGPGVERPRLISSRLGASIDELTHGELREGHHRVISGSILSGRQATGPLAFLGRFHNQISVIAEAAPRADRGWFVPRRAKAFSTYRLGLPSGQSRYAMTTALHGRPCAVFPLGGFERVMPLDILATPLLKALLVEDHQMSQALGCLELDEEDLALCTFVCPSKFDYGALLRTCLTAIEKEG
jgi:Na+-transporting NADH:ubiquinone oxidoreductase subunit A